MENFILHAVFPAFLGIIMFATCVGIIAILVKIFKDL